MKYPKNFHTVINELEKIFEEENNKLFTKLLDNDKYKGFNVDNVSKVVEEFYGEEGLSTKEYTDKDEINNLYNRFNKYKIGIETKMACDDSTYKYKFIMNDKKEYIIELECNMIVLDGKRYVYSYIK